MIPLVDPIFDPEYDRLTGTPREKTIYDWLRHCWYKVVTIEIGKPDPVKPADPKAQLGLEVTDAEQLEFKLR